MQSAGCALLALSLLILHVHAQPVSNLMSIGHDNSLALFPDAPTAWSDNTRRTAQRRAAAARGTNTKDPTKWGAHCAYVWHVVWL